jgi:hypothetical protein
MRNKISTLVGIIIIIVVLVVIFGGVFAYQYFSTKSQLTVPSQQTPISTITTAPVQTAGWETYTDSVANITFQYPAKLNSSYLSLQQKPSVIITPQNYSYSIINADGCYLSSNPTAKNYSQLTLGNMHFCVSSTNEGAAGTFYNTYYYTTLKNGDYYTLEFVISEVDCGVYGGAGDSKYQVCTSDVNNYDSIVTQLIQKSVLTLQAYKSPNLGCATNSDCQNGASCMTEGPLIVNQPVHKVCVPKGQAVPL